MYLVERVLSIPQYGSGKAADVQSFLFTSSACPAVYAYSYGQRFLVWKSSLTVPSVRALAGKPLFPYFGE